MEPSSDEEVFGTSGSALPTELREANGHIELTTHVDNSVYSNKRSGIKDELLGLITDTSNWSGSNVAEIDMSGALSNFTLFDRISLKPDEEFDNGNSSPSPLPVDDNISAATGKSCIVEKDA